MSGFFSTPPRVHILAGLRAAGVLVLLLLTLSASFASSARAADGNAADQLVSLANQARDVAGVPEYVVAADLNHIASQQALRMADQHNIFHNPNLKTEVANWYMVGENVGVGSSAQQIQDAFMASPTHRADILAPDFAEIGVGFAIGDDQRLYVSEVFRLQEARAVPAAEPVAAPKPQPQAAPAPAPTTSTTTRITVPTPTSTAVDAQDRTEMAMARGITSASNVPARPPFGPVATGLIGAVVVIAVLGAHVVVLRRMSLV